jgi:hypothetical protein
MALCNKAMGFFVLNDSSAKDDVQAMQFMRCVMCHSIEIFNANSKSSTKS